MDVDEIIAEDLKPKMRTVSLEQFAKIQTESASLLTTTVGALVQRVGNAEAKIVEMEKAYAADLTTLEKRIVEAEEVISNCIAKEKRHRSI